MSSNPMAIPGAQYTAPGPSLGQLPRPPSLLHVTETLGRAPYRVSMIAHLFSREVDQLSRPWFKADFFVLQVKRHGEEVEESSLAEHPIAS